MSSPISAEVRGVSSDGLMSARLPAASTPASGLKARLMGKFQGLMMPTTPRGWYWIRACMPGVGAGCSSGYIHCVSCSRAWRSAPRDDMMSAARVW